MSSGEAYAIGRVILVVGLVVKEFLHVRTKKLNTTIEMVKRMRSKP